MQELFENDKPFGGRMVILLGDFDQKPPTAGGKSGTLPGVVMKYIEEEGAPPTSKSAEMLGLAQMGGFLFTKFRYIELTTQHRSGDPKHMALINKMSKKVLVPLSKTCLERIWRVTTFALQLTLSLVMPREGISMPGKPNDGLCIMVSTQFVGLVKEKSHLGKGGLRTQEISSMQCITVAFGSTISPEQWGT